MRWFEFQQMMAQPAILSTSLIPECTEKHSTVQISAISYVLNKNTKKGEPRICRQTFILNHRSKAAASRIHHGNIL